MKKAAARKKLILDACCGGRTFWFDKKDPRTLFIDNRIMPRQIVWRRGNETREFEVSPDQVMDFRIQVERGRDSLARCPGPYSGIPSFRASIRKGAENSLGSFYEITR